MSCAGRRLLDEEGAHLEVKRGETTKLADKFQLALIAPLRNRVEIKRHLMVRPRGIGIPMCARGHESIPNF